MDKKKDAEFLASLIDEISLEDTVEQRMNSFARDKERQKRIERARESSSQFQEQYSNQAVEKARQERKPIDLENLELRNETGSPSRKDTDLTGALNQEATRVFPGTMPDTPTIDQAHTRVLSDEDLAHVETMMPPKENETSNYQKIALYVLGAILVVGFCLGGFFLFTSMNPSGSNSPAQGGLLDTMLSWADTFSDLSQADLGDVLKYESMYNQLSSSQKEQLNALLKSRTGYDFDQLLAQAKSQDKEDMTNNDPEIAEKKAQLRDEISYLEGQLSILQTTLDELGASIDEASAQAAAAQQSYDDVRGRYDSASQTLSQSQQEASQIQEQISQDNAALGEINRQLSEVSSTADSEYRSLLAQKSTLESRIAGLQSDLDAANGRISEAQASVDSLQLEMNQAQSALDEANLQLDRANASLANQTTRLEGQIRSLQNQIDEKNKELEALDR